MAVGTIDEKRIEAAVRRLPVLPERKAEISQAVTGLLYVVQGAMPRPHEQAEHGPDKELDDARMAAAGELRDAQWVFYDFKEMCAELSTVARNALNKRIHATGTPGTDLDVLIDRFTYVVDIMAAAAEDLEHPDRPVSAVKADDPASVIAQHAAKMYSRLTGKEPPKPKRNAGIPHGPFYWLLEDVFAAAGIIASTDHYTKVLAKSSLPRRGPAAVR